LVPLPKSAKIGGIIRIRGARDPFLQHPPQRMVCGTLDPPQPHVGQRTYGERDALAREPINQRFVLDRAHAVIDARDTEQVERFPDVAWRPFLAGMRGEEKARLARAVEHALEFTRRVASLGGIEPDADDAILERKRAIERP